MNVPDDLRYSSDHEWVRVEGRRCASASPTTPRTRWATSSTSRCPRWARTVDGRRQGQRGRVDQVGDRHLRPGGRHGRRGQRRAGRRARSGSTRTPTATGWICVIDARRPGRGRGAARRGRVHRPDRRLTERVRWPISIAAAAGTATRSARTSARRAAPSSRPSGPDNTTITFHPAVPSDPVDGVDQPVVERGRPGRRTSAVLVVREGPDRRLAVRPRPRPPPPPAAIPTATSSSTTSPCRAATPRSSAGADGLRGARRRLAQRHLPQPGADRGGPAGQRRRAADRQVQAGVRAGRPHDGAGAQRDRAIAPVHRRGPEPPPGRVPRRHHLQDPLPREPGPARSRAHPVGLPQVLRGRHRAAALDPAPAEGELPAAQGHQGPPGLGPARRRRPAPAEAAAHRRRPGRRCPCPTTGCDPSARPEPPPRPRRARAGHRPPDRPAPELDPEPAAGASSPSQSGRRAARRQRGPTPAWRPSRACSTPIRPG